MTTTHTARRHDLDWLRVVVFVVLIFYHVGMFYVSWDWHVKSDHSSGAIEPVMALVNPWRLPLLFFISGVAIRFLLDTRDRRRVVPERLRRLFLPLAFGMFVLVVPQAYLELRNSGEVAAGPGSFYLQYATPLELERFSVITPTWNHLWYLLYILVYTLLIAATVATLTRLRERYAPRARAILERAPWTVLLIPALPLVAYSLFLDPRFPATHGLVDDWATHAHSLTMVLTGWFVAKSRSFWSAIDRMLVPAGFAAILLGATLTGVRIGRPELVASEATAITVVRTWFAWAMIVVLLSVGQRLLNRPSRALTYATEAVLPWYILHQSIIVVIGYQFIGSGVPLRLEAPAVIFTTVVGCLLLHELLIRRISWLRPLFGLKAPRPGAEDNPDERPLTVHLLQDRRDGLCGSAGATKAFPKRPSPSSCK